MEHQRRSTVIRLSYKDYNLMVRSSKISQELGRSYFSHQFVDISSLLIPNMNVMDYGALILQPLHGRAAAAVPVAEDIPNGATVASTTEVAEEVQLNNENQKQWQLHAEDKEKNDSDSEEEEDQTAAAALYRQVREIKERNEIEQLEARIQRDKALLKKLKESERNKAKKLAGNQVKTREQALEEAQRKKLSRAHDTILKTMIKVMEDCNAQGFIYGVVSGDWQKPSVAPPNG
ncbi:hypothetical protein J5N97_017533 [Dioscorea zingiberensis]|uniref:Ethylene insensitive 3-like DNA-binding domain-containing protein n=1 Tax=Dioscorea zingiberensis TaxID=325984 RepID=A0A9D5CLE2_9LILI|nr:hypothetical protein J5N97_017533 [Dioscorea zingiberensis]